MNKPRQNRVLAGVEFPAPLRLGEICYGQYYYYPGPIGVESTVYNSDPEDMERLRAGLIHLEKDDATKHWRALYAANRAAIDGGTPAA